MIELRCLSVRSGTFQLKGLDLHVPAGGYGVLMGNTGCGKTTLLEAICGLRKVAAGSVRLAGVDVTHWSAGSRGIGYVPQDAALFPTLTVRDHLAFLKDVAEKRAGDEGPQNGVHPERDRGGEENEKQGDRQPHPQLERVFALEE